MNFEYMTPSSPNFDQVHLKNVTLCLKTHGTFLEEPEFDLTTILNGSDGETIVAGAREVVEDISTTMTTFFSD